MANIFRAKSASKGLAEGQESRDPQKPLPGALSNSFNPPLFSQLRPPLPAINNQKNTHSVPSNLPTVSNDVSPIISSLSGEMDLVLPTKVFKAKKTSVNDLSQAASFHLWFRRIREILLVMGKQNDAFSRFDMDLARTDMIQTCEQYLESERPKGGGSGLVRIMNILVARRKVSFLHRTIRIKPGWIDGKTNACMPKHSECPISERMQIQRKRH